MNEFARLLDRLALEPGRNDKVRLLTAYFASTTDPDRGLALAAMAGDESVTATHAAWSGLGVRVIQPPVRQDFGYTFVALDPDGHRLRVFAPGPPPAVPA